MRQNDAGFRSPHHLPTSPCRTAPCVSSAWAEAGLTAYFYTNLGGTLTASTSGLLNRLLTQVARILALNGLEAVTREVVEAAREVLVIGTA